MIKADIVKRVAEELSNETNAIKDKEALEIVDRIIDSFKDIIVDHQRLEIRDFGVFQVKERKARVGRNPKNRVEYPIPSHRVVTFKPGKEIKNLKVATPDDDENDDNLE
jgi:nucleoid DNA-binding protein